MPRLKMIEVHEAEGKAAALFESSNQAFGTVFNLFKGLANAPLALEAYMTLDQLIAAGKLSPSERDIVRLVASQFNGCDYCLAAHTMTGGMNGLSSEEILSIRRGKAGEPGHQALVTFTRAILDSKGFVEDSDLEAFRKAGYDDEHIAEICTILAQKTLSNYFNHINDTELDFPAAPEI